VVGSLGVDILPVVGPVVDSLVVVVVRIPVLVADHTEAVRSPLAAVHIADLVAVRIGVVAVRMVLGHTAVVVRLVDNPVVVHPLVDSSARLCCHTKI